MSLFFIYIFKTISYQRADIRGTRSTSEKRRIAWPEMLIVLFPLFWAINIITNALAYLRIIEGNSGYVLLSVQVSAYQWGWKYCYGDTFYPKFFNNPIIVGKNSIVSNQIAVSSVHRNLTWEKNIIKTLNLYVSKDGKEYGVKIDGIIIKLWDYFWSWNVSIRENQDTNAETYFCRWWLKQSGILENERKNPTKNKLFHGGYWITAQGIDPNVPTFEDNLNNTKKLTIDPLRLLRSTGALVLPTRSNIRLMSCSEDITHSWAVPGIGLKMDCVPGRLFCIYTNVIREGIYFGQCSELCGWNHYNMPVVMYALPLEHFIIWWEIELHSIYSQPFFNYPEDFTKNNIRGINYTLLNFKYK